MDNIYANPVGITKDIYKITNNVNGKIYIGQAKNTAERFKSHCKISSKDCLVDLAIQKYGKENFSVEILENQILNYNERERYWIAQLNTKVPFGYNISDGGEEPPTFYGINHPNASIQSQHILNQIIEDLTDTHLSYQEIADKYIISKKTVLRINHGISYYNNTLEYPLRKIANINGLLTEEQVDEIIDILEHSYDTNSAIGEQFGVSEKTIRLINNGQAHKRNRNYPIRPINAARSKLTYNQLMEVIELIQHTDLSYREIGRCYGIDHNTVIGIANGVTLYNRREFTYPLRLPPHKK